jgi:hypothetical protein
MRSQRIDSRRCTTGADDLCDEHEQSHVEGAIIALLLSDDHHGLWAREELIREQSATRLETIDALAALTGAGLVHDVGDFVVATRAARHMDQLDL